MVRGLALAVVLFLAPGGARADNSAEALKFIDVGVSFYKAGDLEAAHSSFVRARDLAPDKPGPYRWLGLTQAKLGRCAEAVESLDKFISGIHPNDPRIPEATAARDTCKAVLQHGAPPTPPPPRAPAETKAAVIAVVPPPPPALPQRKIEAPPPPARPPRVEAPLAPPPPVMVAPPPHAAESPNQPVYKKWWLWTAVGAVLVLGGAGAVSGAALTPDNATPPPAGLGTMAVHF